MSTQKIESKTLKSLVSKIKTIFDNLNLQQNSIDDLTDKLTASAKDKKRTNDQISQILSQTAQQKGLQDENLNRLNSQVNSLVQRNIQYDHLLSHLKVEMGQIAHQVSQITGKLANLRNKISLCKTEHMRVPEKDHRQYQQTFDQERVLSEILDMKRENRVHFDEIRNLLKKLKPAEMKEKTEPQPASILSTPDLRAGASKTHMTPISGTDGGSKSQKFNRLRLMQVQNHRNT